MQSVVLKCIILLHAVAVTDTADMLGLPAVQVADIPSIVKTPPPWPAASHYQHAQQAHANHA